MATQKQKLQLYKLLYNPNKRMSIQELTVKQQIMKCKKNL